MQGRLGEKLVSDLIRDIAQKKASGLLRLSKGKIIKAVFFAAGTPVFAISNSADEQLDQHLLKLGLVTPEQIEQAKDPGGIGGGFLYSSERHDGWHESLCRRFR